MKWEKYTQCFMQLAKQKGFDDAYISRCLQYANKLYVKNIPIIYDQKHFCQLVGYSPAYVRAASKFPHKFYRYFTIQKKRNGVRDIAEPLPNLKEIQLWILREILYHCQVSDYAKGFVLGRSIKENARFHRKQAYVLALDIQDFFPSIKAAKIYKFYTSLGYRKSVAIMLTRLCTLNGILPQGAPTSPALSNLINLDLDKRLAGYAIKNNLHYTRYADDLTFSGNLHPGPVIHTVRKILFDEQLMLNQNKTKFMPNYKCQEVTGIVVNQKLQVSRKKRRVLRQAVYYIKKYGLESHVKHKNIPESNYFEHLLGQVNFARFVNPNDKNVYKAYHILSEYKKNRDRPVQVSCR